MRLTVADRGCAAVAVGVARDGAAGEEAGVALGREPAERAAIRTPRRAPGGGGGHGLTGMRERAELLGGQLAAGPDQGGFRVALWLPA